MDVCMVVGSMGHNAIRSFTDLHELGTGSPVQATLTCLQMSYNMIYYETGKLVVRHSNGHDTVPSPPSLDTNEAVTRAGTGTCVRLPKGTTICPPQKWVSVVSLLQQLAKLHPKRSCNVLREMASVLGIV